MREATGARVIVCTSEPSEDAVLAALQAGAVGFLRKDTLTARALAAAVQAAAGGTGVVAPDLLGNLVRGVSADGATAGPRSRASPSASSRSWR